MTPGPYSTPCRVIHHGNYTVIYLWETSIGSSESIWGTWHGSLLWEPKKVSHTGSLAFQGFHSSCLPHARLSRDKKSKRIPLVLPLLVSTLSSYGSTANLRMSCISALEKSTGKLLRYRFRAEIHEISSNLACLEPDLPMRPRWKWWAVWMTLCWGALHTARGSQPENLANWKIISNGCGSKEPLLNYHCSENHY